MSYKAIKFSEMYEDLMEHQKNIAEAIDAKKIIDELIDTSFGGSNESQMKAVQLLKGLATSDDPASNAFMKKLDAWTSGLKKIEKVKKIACLECDEVSTKAAWKKNKGFCPKCKKSTQGVAESLTESIKSDLDKLGADSMKRDGKLIILTWKEEGKVTKADIEKVLSSKVKFIGVTNKNGKTVAEIEMI